MRSEEVRAIVLKTHSGWKPESSTGQGSVEGGGLERDLFEASRGEVPLLLALLLVRRHSCYHPQIPWGRYHLFLVPDLVFPLQPVSGGGGGELRNLVPLQFPHLSHHAGGQLVLDALALPGLQVSAGARLAKRQDPPKGSGSSRSALLTVVMRTANSLCWGLGGCRGRNWELAIRRLFWRLEDS